MAMESDPTQVRDLRSALSTLRELLDEDRLVDRARAEIDRLIPAERRKQRLVRPGEEAQQGLLARGWARRAALVPSTAGVRFVRGDGWTWTSDLGVARPGERSRERSREEAPGGALDAPQATFALLVDADVPLESDRSSLRVLGRAGRLQAVQADRARAAALHRAHPGKVRLARPLVACTGGTAPAGLGRVHVDAGATGDGVLVGIADFRIDFFHSNLRGADGRTRIAALWDQEARYDGRGQPGPGGIGVVYTAQDIDRELLDGDPPYTHVPHRWVVADGSSLQEVHGTHVASMAVGTGASSLVPSFGAAPGARLLFVNLRTELQLAQEGVRFDFALEDSVLLAVQWMDRVARDGLAGACDPDSPLVLSLSLADYTGPRDGSGLAADLAAAVLGDNRALVLAAGNGDDPSVHAAVALAPGEATTLQVDYADIAGDSDLIEIYSPYAPIRVTVHSPDFGAGAAVIPDSPGHVGGGRVPGPAQDRVDVRITSGAGLLPGGDHRVRVELAGLGGQPRPLQGTWKLEIRRTGAGAAGPARIDVYGAIGNEERRTFDPPAEGRYTLSDLATADGVLTVGAHLRPLADGTRRIWGDSGRGPTRAGLAKPELATEGASLRSSQPWPRYTLQDKALGQESVRSAYLSGTSLAAPVAAGALACRMQRLGLGPGRSLSAEEIRRDFLRAVRLDGARLEDGSALPAEDLAAAFGQGWLDAEALAALP